MTTFTPAYRLTVYKPRSAQSAVTEPDILSPIGGAAHSDPFKVASMTGVSGFQPYLDGVSGRRGKIDPLTKKVTTGQLTMRLLDIRTGSSNLQRWVTAFLGNSAGRNQLLGCKAYVEESLDGGSTWSPFFVGRITATDLDDPLRYALTVQDYADDLDMPVFVGRPASSISYAAEPMLLPLGLSATYGVQTAATVLSGAFGAASWISAGYRVLTLDAASQARLDNVVTRALFRQDVTLSDVESAAALTRLNKDLRLRFTSTSPSITDKELRPVRFIVGRRGDGTCYVKKIALVALDSGDPYYQAFDTGSVPNATTCTFTVRLARYDDLGGEDTSPADDAPLYLGTTPMQLWQDVLDGKFGRLYEAGGATPPTGKSVGDPMRSIPYTSAGGSMFDKLASATNRDPLPACRLRVVKPMSARTLIEQMGQYLGLSYRMEPVLNGSVPECRFTPVDMRLPVAAAIAGIPTVADADIDTSALPTWSQNRTDAVTRIVVTWHDDYPWDPNQLGEWSQVFRLSGRTAFNIPDVPVSLLSPVENREILWDYGRVVDLGDRDLTIDAFGLRGTPTLTDTVANRQAEAKVQAEAQRVMEFYRSQFGAGPITVEFTARRTANTTGLWPGDWCYLDVDVLPDAATNVRGGTRLVQILERQEQGLTIKFSALDAGAGASCGVPTIGTPTQTSGATAHSIDVSVTVNAAGEPVELRTSVQATTYGSSPPADSDSGWVYGGRVTGTGTAVVGGLPAGKRVFVQGRSVPKADGTADAPKLPSAWTSPSGTKYVDMATITAPSGVTVLPSPILTTSTVTGTWTNGTAALPVEVTRWDSGGTSQLALYGVYPPGSVGPVTLNEGLGSSTTYTLKVRHLDELGGGSAYGSTTFTTPASFVGSTLSAPTLTILQGG